MNCGLADAARGAPPARRQSHAAIRVVSALPEHFARIQLRDWQVGYAPHVVACGQDPRITCNSWTGLRTGTDQILVIAGIIERWHGHGNAYAFIADGISGREWVAITRAVQEHLTRALADDYRRIEAWAHAEPLIWCDIACTWLERLGFECEGLARNFTPDGTDMMIYSRCSDVRI